MMHGNMEIAKRCADLCVGRILKISAEQSGLPAYTHTPEAARHALYIKSVMKILEAYHTGEIPKDES